MAAFGELASHAGKCIVSAFLLLMIGEVSGGGNPSDLVSPLSVSRESIDKGAT